MPDTHRSEPRTKPQIYFSHQSDIPEEAEMVTCEDCDGTGLAGEDTIEHRAFACVSCYGHGVVFVLWPKAEEALRKPAAEEGMPVRSKVA
jgi:DnaJ-class molecular chaperone